MNSEQAKRYDLIESLKTTTCVRACVHRADRTWSDVGQFSCQHGCVASGGLRGGRFERLTIEKENFYGEERLQHYIISSLVCIDKGCSSLRIYFFTSGNPSRWYEPIILL